MLIFCLRPCDNGKHECNPTKIGGRGCFRAFLPIFRLRLYKTAGGPKHGNAIQQYTRVHLVCRNSGRNLLLLSLSLCLTATQVTRVETAVRLILWVFSTRVLKYMVPVFSRITGLPQIYRVLPDASGCTDVSCGPYAIATMLFH